MNEHDNRREPRSVREAGFCGTVRGSIGLLPLDERVSQEKDRAAGYNREPNGYEHNQRSIAEGGF